MGCPEHRSSFLGHFLGQILDWAVFDAFGHAMLYTCRFKTLTRTTYAEAAEFGGERYEGQIGSAVRQHLDVFGYLHPHHPLWSTVLLGTGDLTGVASGTVLVVYQETVLGSLTHDEHPPLKPCRLCRADV